KRFAIWQEACSRINKNRENLAPALDSCHGIDFSRAEMTQKDFLPLCRKPARSEAERLTQAFPQSLRPFGFAQGLRSALRQHGVGGATSFFGTTESGCPDTRQIHTNCLLGWKLTNPTTAGIAPERSRPSSLPKWFRHA